MPLLRPPHVRSMVGGMLPVEQCICWEKGAAGWAVHLSAGEVLPVEQCVCREKGVAS